MIERRLHRRFLLTLDVRLRRADTDWQSATTCDLSPAAVGLQLTRDTVRALGGSGNILLPGERIMLVFGDSEADRHDEFTCRVRQVRRISRNEYVAGAAFDALTTSNERVLRELLGGLAGQA